MCTAAVFYGFEPYSQYQAGVAQNKYYNSLADQARTEADTAIKQGDLQSKLIQDTASQEGKQLKTQQAEFNAASQAALAANGVYGGGTAEDIANSNLSKQQLDEMALRYNADVKSYNVTEAAKNKRYSLLNQANDYNYQGKAAKYAGKVKAFSTLLGTAKQAAQLGFGAA